METRTFPVSEAPDGPILDLPCCLGGVHAALVFRALGFGQVQFAATANFENSIVIGIVHAQRHVGLQFLLQAVPDLAAGDELAFAAGQRAGVDADEQRLRAREAARRLGHVTLPVRRVPEHLGDGLIVGPQRGRQGVPGGGAQPDREPADVHRLLHVVGGFALGLALIAFPPAPQGGDDKQQGTHHEDACHDPE